MKKFTEETFMEWDNHISNNSKSLDNIKIEIIKYRKFKEIIEKISTKSINEFIEKGWMDSKNDIKSLYFLFNSLSNDSSNIMFRKSDSSNNNLILIWLSRINQIAEFAISLKRIPSYKGIDENFLKELIKLSPNENIIKELPQILEKKGIILIYEEALTGMKLDGCVYNIKNTNNPVIAMSFRYKRIDNFWFTLLHELSHIILHFDKLDSPIIDDFDNLENNLIEKQADKLTLNTIMNKSVWRTFVFKKYKEAELIEYAEKNSIHPAILAGRIRREKNQYNLYNKIINKTDIRSLVFEK